MVGRPLIRPQPTDEAFTKRLSGSSILDRYLQQLKSLQTEHSIEALKHPKDRDAFEYGQKCGILEGLLRAEQLLLTATQEGDDENE